LITISTRASLKKYHTFNLTLGLGPHGTEWEYERIGSHQQKINVARELQELRGRLTQVEQWKRRYEWIEKDLANVWADGGDGLLPNAYEEGKSRKIEVGIDGLAPLTLRHGKS
jgi:ATP-binding cassette, subfamily D (ALD), peroxisomal long-chain fatty acid import protein